MNTVTFDSLEGIAKLRAAGFDAKQAEAVVRVLAESQDGPVIRHHFNVEVVALRTDMDAGFILLQADIAHTCWMLGIVLALSATSFAKQFF